MIALLNGTIARLDIDAGTAVVRQRETDTGYEVVLPCAAQLPPYIREGMDPGFWIYHHITPDSQTLFAFLSYEDRAIALKLMKVQGVGARVAHRVVTTHGADRVLLAISTGDAKSLAAGVSGLGPKNATKIVDALKASFQKLVSGSGDPRLPRVRAALHNLGVSYDDADLIELCKTDPDATDSELVKAITSAR